MAFITLAQNVAFGSGPNMYVTFSYEKERNGSTMRYRTRTVISSMTGSHYFGYYIAQKLSLNGVQKEDERLKENSPSQWSSPITYTSPWYDVPNKTSGTTPVKFNLYSNSGRSATYEYNLAVDPAYTSITEFIVSKISGYSGLTSLKVSWKTSNTIDYLWYSKDNGSSWTGLDVADGTSGSFNISGLSPNACYNFKIRVRRKDSQLTTDSSTYYAVTYDINRITSENLNVSNGSSLNVKANNPSGSSCQIRLETVYNGVATSRYVKSGTNVTFSETEINSLMQYFPNNATFNINLVAETLNNSVVGYKSPKTGKYTIINSNPTFTNFSYLDSNSDIVSITQDNQVIVKNHSILRIAISSSNKMTCKNGSTPVRYDITIANRSGSLNYSENDTYIDLSTINIAGNQSINVTAVDSRGFRTTKTININVVDYENPICNTTLGRVNNFEENSSISVIGIYSTINNKNSILEVAFRYKLKAETWDDVNWTIFDVVQSNGSYETEVKNLILNNQESFDFQVRIKDKINTNGIVFDYILDEGIPIAFFNASKKNVGIGCINEHEEYSLEVKGNIYLNSGNAVLDYEVIEEWEDQNV